MNISETTAPKSDQQNYDDIPDGQHRTVTVKSVTVTKGADQPVAIELIEFPGRPYKPSKSMRRVIIAAWGDESDNYTGRRLTIFGNPKITFGRDEVGGIEISHISHIDKPIKLMLTRTRAQRKPFTVQPLIVRDWLAELKQAGDNLDTITALGKAATVANAPQNILDAIRDEYHRANGATQ